jgi:D-3-phosphoglycerate dehydrogenase
MAKIKLALLSGVQEPYLGRIKDACETTFWGRAYQKPITSPELLQAASGSEIVYVGGEVVTREMIGAWKESGLKLLGCGRGTPVNVDWKAVVEFGIPLVYTPGRNAESVAE